MTTKTNIPAPRCAFIDQRTGLMAREWYMFFLNIFSSLGSGQNTISIIDMQMAPQAQGADSFVDNIEFESRINQLSSAYNEVIDSVSLIPAEKSQLANDDSLPYPRQLNLIDSNYTINGDLILPKVSGKGIRVDKVSPTFGWRQMSAPITPKGTGANNPIWSVFRGTLSAYKFDNTLMREVWVPFRMPHDYVPGTDLFLSVHWAQNVVDTGGTAGVPGVCKIYFDITYADGYGTPGGASDPYIAPYTVSVTQQASTTQYGHMTAEVQISNNGGTGGLIDSNTISVAGIFGVRLYRDASDVADTLNQSIFIMMCELCYQSTNIATKQRVPDFYA